MTTFIRNFSFPILFLMLFIPAYAQVQLGVEIGPGIPLGDFEDFYEVGVGGRFKFNYFVNDNVAVGTALGIYGFGFEFNDDLDLISVPWTFHGEYFFKGPKASPYLGAGIGMCFLSWENNGRGRDFNFDNDDVRFAGNLGGGVLFNVQKNLELGGDMRFHLVEDASFFAIKFVLAFKL